MTEKIPDVPVPITAWKAFRKVRGKWVSPVFTPDSKIFPLKTPVSAQCLGMTQTILLQYIAINNENTIDYVRDHGPAPGARCACGFYVCKDRRIAERYGTHIARVRVWGKVIEHEFGYRAQHLELIEKPQRVYGLRSFFSRQSWWFRIYLISVLVVRPIAMYFKWDLTANIVLAVGGLAFLGVLWEIFFSKKSLAPSLGWSIARSFSDHWTALRKKKAQRDADTKPRSKV